MAKKNIGKRKSIMPERRKTKAVPVKKGTPGMKYIALAGILIAVALAFSNVTHNQFTSFDDDTYVTNNQIIQNFEPASVPGLFTSFYAANYHPLTMISYAIDYQLAGMDPGPYHLHNLLLHLLNVVLVFVLVYMLFRNTGIAAMIAILFGIHPMHVESVSWVAERKDVLYSLFYLSALVFYVHFLLKDYRLKYLIAALLCFILALLSKSMAVTLPLIMLLMDWYFKRKPGWKLIIEKLPFFALSLLFGILAMISQKTGGATEYAPYFPAGQRIFLVCYAVIFYLFKFFIPVSLSAVHFYPKTEGGLLPLIYYLSPLILMIFGVGIWRAGRYRKDLLWGIAFFLASISVVLQVLPVGKAITAERYTYLPYLGLLISGGMVYQSMLKNNLKSFNKLKILIISISVIYLVAFFVLTWERKQVWKDSRTLFADVVDKYPEASFGYLGLGKAVQESGDNQGALEIYDKGIALDSNFSELYNNRGLVHYYLKDYNKALPDLERAVKLNPGNANPHMNLGIILALKNDHDGSMKEFNKSLELDPGNAEAFFNRGVAKLLMKDSLGACADWKKAEGLGSLRARNFLLKNCRSSI